MDKQIIIDDLDTRCPYHCSEKIGQCNNSSQETPHTYCIDNKDCIYKQYTRKEQQCEELKEQLEIAKQNYSYEAEKLEIYMQTLAEIKEIAEEKAKVNDWLALDILQKINEVTNE